MNLTIDVVDNYIEKISQLHCDDEYKTKFTTLLNYLKDTLNFQKIPFSENRRDDVYSILGYSALMENFRRIIITKNNIEVYLILKNLIETVESSKPIPNNPELSRLKRLLIEYKKDTLEEALNIYKKKMLDIDSHQAFKDSFFNLCEDIKNLDLHNHELFNHIRQQIKVQYRQRRNECKQQIQYDLDKGLLSGVWTIATQNRSLNIQVAYPRTQEAAAKFYFEVITLSYKDKFTLNDILKLKDVTERYRDHLLELPEIQRVSHHGPLVNVLCNVINACIFFITGSRPFESIQSQNIHQFFSRWDRLYDKAEQKKNEALSF